MLGHYTTGPLSDVGAGRDLPGNRLLRLTQLRVRVNEGCFVAILLYCGYRCDEALKRIVMTTTLQPADRSSVDREEALARARQFYAEEILPKYGKSHRGHFIVIDGLSLDYEIGRSGWDSEAAVRFERRRPDSISLTLPIGRDGFLIGRYYSPEECEEITLEMDRRFSS